MSLWGAWKPCGLDWFDAYTHQEPKRLTNILHLVALCITLLTNLFWASRWGRMPCTGISACSRLSTFVRRPGSEIDSAVQLLPPNTFKLQVIVFSCSIFSAAGRSVGHPGFAQAFGFLEPCCAGWQWQWPWCRFPGSTGCCIAVVWVNFLFPSLILRLMTRILLSRKWELA